MENFLETIREVTGGAPSISEIVPGKMIRFATSDRSGDDAGWCKLFEDSKGGVFGCWRQGISEDWHVNTVKSPEEHAAFQVQVKHAKEEADRIGAELRAKCRDKSAELWEKGHDAEARHPYLFAKNIKHFGIRQLGSSLMVQVKDTAGILHGLQFIMPDGTKRFKSGTAVTGCYHSIGKANGTILIAEGYATPEQPCMRSPAMPLPLPSLPAT